MGNHFFLTLDNGGTNTKALLFDAGGNQLDSSSFATPWIQRDAGRREISLDVLKDSLFQAVRNLLEKSSIQPGDVACISCAGHGKGLYLLNRENGTFHNGILSTDERGNALAGVFEQRIDDIYSISAQHVMPSQAPVLLRWMKENEPAAYSEIGAVLSAKDFVRFLLTGEVQQERGDASGNNFVNLHTREYDDALLNFFGIEEMGECLPPLVNSGDIVSFVNNDAAKSTGLAAGTPVIGGLFDIDAGTLGSGILDGEYFAVIAGTWNINTYLSDEPTDLKAGIMNSLYLDNLTMVEASSPTSAGNLDKVLKLLLPDKMKQEGKAVYAELEEYLENTDASSTSVLYTPFLYGSNTDPDASASFVGIDSTTSSMQLLRAVYEGIAFAHKQHIDQLLETVSRRPSALRVSGGAANSSAWMQIFADVTGLPVETLESEETTGLGGAILSSCASGVYQSLAEAARNMVRVKSRHTPDPSQHEIYAKKYDSYQILLRQLNGQWGKLSIRKGEER